VLGAHGNGNYFVIAVAAVDGLRAFGAAATLLQEAGAEPGAVFHAAIPHDVPFDLPGDSLVSLDTVLDPEQAEVFGISV